MKETYEQKLVRMMKELEDKGGVIPKIDVNADKEVGVVKEAPPKIIEKVEEMKEYKGFWG